MLAVSTLRPFSHEMDPSTDIPVCCWNFCYNVAPGRMPVSKEEQQAKVGRAVALAFGVGGSAALALPTVKKGLAQ